MISEKAVKIHVEFYSFRRNYKGMGNTAKRRYFLVLQGVSDALDDAAKVTLR